MSTLSITDREAPGSAMKFGRSRPVAPHIIIFSTILRNLRVAVRYLPNLAGSLAEMGIRAAFFFLMASAINVRPMEAQGIEFTDQETYTFFLGSLVLFTFTRSTMWGPINAVTNDLYNGTLEYLYSLPGSRYAYYVGVVMAEVILNLPIFIPLFLLLVIQASITLVNVALNIIKLCPGADRPDGHGSDDRPAGITMAPGWINCLGVGYLVRDAGGSLSPAQCFPSGCAFLLLFPAIYLGV